MVDSDITPLDPGTFGSRVTFITGNAVRIAAEDVRNQLSEVAANALEANPKDIVFKDRKVYVAGSPDRSMPFGKLVKIAQYSGTGKTIIGRGYWAPEELEGSATGGVGHALTEEIIRKEGQTMNPSFLEYRMATSLDACKMEILHTDTCDDLGPFGAKESGEGIQVAVVPAIVNALYDAMGVPFKRIPVTPDVVLNALKGKFQEKV